MLLNNQGASVEYLGINTLTGEDQITLLTDNIHGNDYNTDDTDFDTLNKKHEQLPFLLNQLSHFKKFGFYLDFDLKKVVNHNNNLNLDFRTLSQKDALQLYNIKGLKSKVMLLN